MANMEIDDIFCVCPLDTDCKRFRRVKREGNETSSCGRWGLPSNDPGVYLEFEETRISSIESIVNKFMQGQN